MGELDPLVLTAPRVPEGLVLSGFLLLCPAPAISCPSTGLFPKETVCHLQMQPGMYFLSLSAHDEIPSAGQMKTGVSQNCTQVLTGVQISILLELAAPAPTLSNMICFPRK